MKKFKKTKILIISMALFLGVFIVPGIQKTPAEAAAKVTVKKVIAVNKKTKRKKIQLAKGETTTLKTTVIVTPNTSANKKVIYKSSNKRIASVTSKGIITGRKAGTAKITVRSKKNKKKKAVVTVKVVNKKRNTSKYHYELKFFRQPYSGTSVIVYIKTNNPSYDSFNIEFYDAQKKRARLTSHQGTSFEDLKCFNGDSGYTSVKDGYLERISLKESGTYNVKVREYAKKEKNSWISKSSADKFADLGYIDVKDYKQEFDAWMQSVIDQTTTPSMTKKEQMEAITNYLRMNSIYTKTSTVTGHYIYLAADSGVPFWKFHPYEHNSYTSPAILCHFGKKIGYPLINLYGKYAYGTPEWFEWHMKAQSVEDGSYYQFCALTETNLIDPSTIQQIDLSKWNYYECYKFSS